MDKSGMTRREQIRTAKEVAVEQARQNLADCNSGISEIDKELPELDKQIEKRSKLKQRRRSLRRDARGYERVVDSGGRRIYPKPAREPGPCIG